MNRFFSYISLFAIGNAVVSVRSQNEGIKINPTWQQNGVQKPVGQSAQGQSNIKNNPFVLQKPPLTTQEEYILQSFPEPKLLVVNFFSSVCAHLGRPGRMSEFMNETYIREPNQMWKCTIDILWPWKETFVYSSVSKSEAAKIACTHIIAFLQAQNKIDRSGRAVLVDKQDLFEMMEKPLAEVVIRDEHLKRMDDLFAEYSDSQIEVIIAKNKLSPPEFDIGGFTDDFMSDVAFRFRKADWYTARNSKLYEGYVSRQEKEMAKSLPIMPFRDRIIEEIENHRVIVIEGETGCGKSTQVPQIIFDHYIKNLRGSECNIIVAEPRRISALALADWVAKERYEAVGDSIGYHVRLHCSLPPKRSGSIVFVTAGLLLRKIVSQPDLPDFSHVIIDEAHERSIDIDLLLYLLKRALQLNPQLRVIIMSATINTKLFQMYYKAPPPLTIPGFVYPVQSYFFDRDMITKLQLRESPKVLLDPYYRQVDYNVVIRMVLYIHEHRPEGAILVFLPGWSHIKTLTQELSQNPNLFVVSAHSKLSKDEQFMIFQRPPPGKRKVILATNIAETGITIDDVSYVVDTGIHKEERMEVGGYSSVGMYWISQANVRQRQGRAGRTRPGECYHLFTQEVYNSMDKYPRPEIQCVPLDKTILVCKAYTNTNEKMVDFLGHLPEPPGYYSVQQAVKKLQDMRALTETEELTPLGKRIYLFTLDPLLSKAVVYAALFKCMSPVLTESTILSAGANIFPSITMEKERVRDIKASYSPTSDHLACSWIFLQWDSLKTDREQQYNFALRNQLGFRSLSTVSSLRFIHRDYLADVHLVRSEDLQDCLVFDTPINKHSRSDELVKSVIFSGVNNLLVVRNFEFVKGRLRQGATFSSEAGGQIQLMAESVNSKRQKFPVPFLTYFDNHRSLERRATIVYDTSIISVLTLFLFYGKDFKTKPSFNLPEGYALMGLQFGHRNPLNIVGNQIALQKLSKLKTILWDVIDYLVIHTGFSESTEEFQQVSNYRDKLLEMLVKLLDEEGTKIDYDETGKLRS